MSKCIFKLLKSVQSGEQFLKNSKNPFQGAKMGWAFFFFFCILCSNFELNRLVVIGHNQSHGIGSVSVID